MSPGGVRARFLNGDEVTLPTGATALDVRLEVGTLSNHLLPEVQLVTQQGDVLLYDDPCNNACDQILCPPLVTVLFTSVEYDDEKWKQTLVDHAVARDRAGIHCAMERIITDPVRGPTCARRLCGDALLRLFQHPRYKEYNNSPAVIALLLDAKAAVDCPDPDGSGATALWHASCYGRVAVSQLLLDARAAVGVRDVVNGTTPIWWAAVHGCQQLASMLIRAHADVNVVDAGGRSALWCASFEGYTELARTLISAKASVDCADSSERTALWWSAYRGFQDLAELMVDSKADVNGCAVRKSTIYRSTSNTPLWYAVQRGFLPIVRSLIAARAEVNLTAGTHTDDESGRSALWCAASNGAEDMVTLLLEAHADANQADARGRTPLAQAEYNKELGTADILRRHGAKRGRCPLNSTLGIYHS